MAKYGTLPSKPVADVSGISSPISKLVGVHGGSFAYNQSGPVHHIDDISLPGSAPLDPMSAGFDADGTYL